MDQRSGAQRSEDRPQRISDRQHEAPRGHAERAPGVHERRRVRQELAGAHHRGERLGPAVGRFPPVGVLGGGHVGGHPIDHVPRRFDHPALGVAPQVTAASAASAAGDRPSSSRGWPAGEVGSRTAATVIACSVLPSPSCSRSRSRPERALAHRPRGQRTLLFGAWRVGSYPNGSRSGRSGEAPPGRRTRGRRRRPGSQRR
jgi:hypothetical protein